MVSTSIPQPINGGLLLSSPNSSFSHYHQHSATIFKWGLRRYQAGSSVTSRTKGQAFRILANPNVSPGKGDPNYQILMVDPLEAKRLAAKQMQEIQAKEKFKIGPYVAISVLDMTLLWTSIYFLGTKENLSKEFMKILAVNPVLRASVWRRRQIEAINGAWAMIGLTAGLVIEGHTGKSFLDQLAGYWFAIVNFFVR